MKVLITGASGFIGKSLTDLLLKDKDKEINLSVKDKNKISKINNIDKIIIQEIDNITDWSFLRDYDVVIHLAATQHLSGKSKDLNKYRNLNIDGTKRLVDCVIRYNVKKFIYLSTVQVHGEFSPLFSTFDENSNYNPQSAYALSKKISEQYIINKFNTSKNSCFIIIRSPLVYGKGVKGNLKSLKNLVNSNLPLPLDGIKNLRSFISLTNLNNFIKVSINSDNLKNETFLLSDNNDISTSDLIAKMIDLSKKKKIFFKIPSYLLKFVLILLNRKSYIAKLFLNSRVDVSKALNMTNWKPLDNSDSDIIEMLNDDN